MTMQSINIDNDVLSRISNAEDRELAIGVETITLDEARELFESETTINELFNTVDTSVHTSGQEANMQSDTNTTNTKALIYMGSSFECTTGMDEKFDGKTITPDDFESLSKSMLLRLVSWQHQHIDTQDTKQVERMTQRADNRSTALVGQAKLEALKAMGLWDELSEQQIEWMRAEKERWTNIVVKPSNNGYKVSFNHKPKTRAILVKKLQEAGEKAGRTVRVQQKHVYVRMS